MTDDKLLGELARLFERHELELEPDEDWLLTDGDYPAVRAHWEDAPAPGQPGRLDIDLVLDEDRRLELSYAGNGRGEAGWRDALERFARGDLAVLLAACWYLTDERKLELAQWELGLRQWDAFIGRFVVEGADIAVPPGILASVADALKGEALAPSLHWVRLFLRRAGDGTLSTEVLLDNAPWPAGDRALAALAWPEAAQAYDVRALVALDVRDY
ncbi:MAG TPA: DUF6348 family protein [Frateuria sp.]|uniref:DUF6348 family protein n=1 Tax=Frateuria sp. TaxID=2211372 RepID=UPI002D7E5C4B|nr:DUF6348 family protein [Frateuria sp.]HET6806016.1 DUF6348 family protein [Frateuria sp.]